VLDAFDHILIERKIAYAVFDQDFILTKNSRNFPNIIHNHAIEPNSSIWDIFPELFGSENQVNAVFQKKQKKYQIEKINKYSEGGALHYYDLTLLPWQGITNNLLCIIADTTAETSLEQEIRQKKFEIEMLQASLSSYGNYFISDILGESHKIQEVREFVGKIANIRSTTVLLQGESGTGKNLVARAIHKLSLESKSPFIEVNCASIPATLLESEIFGHERGAFTSAIASKKGLLEEAHGGTFFLDEIGELPISLQSKFLSFLENKNFRRLGSTQERKVDIRVIAATNKDLKQAVENHEFRQDLFFRINVVNLNLPPLRELGNDIIIMADHFVRIFAYDFKKKVKGLTEGAKNKLLNYPWPGNVRELRNVIERAVIFAEGEKIGADKIVLTDEKQITKLTAEFSIPETGISLFDVEKKLIIDALAKTKGNQSRAAKLLRLSLDTFRYRMKKYEIKS
jgi:transcriptional regulator with PAS, ATPase and Fis domain